MNKQNITNRCRSHNSNGWQDERLESLLRTLWWHRTRICGKFYFFISSLFPFHVIGVLYWFKFLSFFIPCCFEKGAPIGWYSKSYYWLPSAITYHRINKYLKHLEGMDPSSWVKYFYPANDDDIYDNPPDLDLVYDETRFTTMSRHIRKRLY